MTEVQNTSSEKTILCGLFYVCILGRGVEKQEGCTETNHCLYTVLFHGNSITGLGSDV